MTHNDLKYAKFFIISLITKDEEDVAVVQKIT